MNALRPRILHVVGTLGGGGVQRLVLGLAAAPSLAHYAHDVMCVFGAKGEMSDAFRGAGFRIVDCPFPWPSHLPVPSYRISRWIRCHLEWTFSARFARHVRGLESTLVHTHVTSRIDLQALGTIGHSGRPWVWTLHGQYTPSAEARRQWRRAFNLVSRGRACVTADSAAVARHVAGQGLADEKQIRILHPGVDLSRIRGREPRPRMLRERLGIPASAVVFGAAGRLVTEKAYDVLIEAVSRLRDVRPAVYVVIAGEGTLGDSLQETIVRAGLTSRVHLLGYVDDVPSFLAELDVFAMPSRSEGFPIALLEALASGLPCVATRAGGIPEVLDAKEFVLVDRDSPEALAAAMHDLLDPERRLCVAAAGAGLAERFSIDACASRFAALYDDLAVARCAGETA